MNKIFTLSLAFCSLGALAQSYAPPAGTAGTTAIHTDSSAFVAWATGVEVKRGYLNIADTNFMLNGSNKASFGAVTEALGKAEGSSMQIVSLGDGGMATLTFAHPITDGPGPDFAVFENGFQPDYLELAFVEVSSDGVYFFRFPAHSENQFATQIGGTGTMDCRNIHNLAGKYQQGYGTPFDLSDLPSDQLLDITSITHVRIIDVVGTIDPAFATYDSQNNMVNDPYPTPFASGGFDLDGVGVIHQKSLGIVEQELFTSIYPNPARTKLTITLEKPCTVRVTDLTGKVLFTQADVQNESLDVSGWDAGIYILEVSDAGKRVVKRVVVG